MSVTERAIPTNVVDDIVSIGRFASDRHWVPATAGNFSRRIDSDTVAVTRSGRDKGALTADDVIAVSIHEPLPPGVSAEAPLHVARYDADPNVGAVLHVHTVAATVLSRAALSTGSLVLEGYEMFKTLEGYTTHEGTLSLPVFENAQDTITLARDVEKRLKSERPTPAYLLAGHGFYVWGATMQDARRHLEGVEFLLQCALEERRIHG